MVRAFIAIELSEDIRDNLTKAQECLRKCSARLTFVRPDYIHVTVKFLGEVEEENLKNVIDTLKTVTFLPFTVSATGVTVDNFRQPHTVWCTIEDSGESATLFHRIEEVLGLLGFGRETRRFTPHATIARVRRADKSLYTSMDTLKNKTYGSCVVSGFTLKKSTLTPHGPVYEDLLEVAW